MDDSTALRNLSAYQRGFVKWSAIAVVVFAIFSYLLGDGLYLIFLKATVAPIYVLANQARNVIWPKPAKFSLKALLSEKAVTSLIFSFLMVLMFISPERSLETLANVYVFLLVGYFLATVALDYFQRPPGAQQLSDKNS